MALALTSSNTPHLSTHTWSYFAYYAPISPITTPTSWPFDSILEYPELLTISGYILTADHQILAPLHPEPSAMYPTLEPLGTAP